MPTESAGPNIRIQPALRSRAAGEEQSIDVGHVLCGVENDGADERHEEEVGIWLPSAFSSSVWCVMPAHTVNRKEIEVRLEVRPLLGYGRYILPQPPADGKPRRKHVDALDLVGRGSRYRREESRGASGRGGS
jgi:hypothetical protein